MLYKVNSLKIYNSITGQKETFRPLHEGQVGMYVCGPTVYSHVHVGNLRTFLSFDTVYRYLLHLGFNVRYVRNITDVGHLVDDADEGEDKIAKKARLEKLEPMEIVHRYTMDFHDILREFNLLSPSIEPTATGHIVEQIAVIKRIMGKGYAYESNGSVYFDVAKYNRDFEYGMLSNRQLEEMVANTRKLAGHSDKRNEQDFAMWKRADPGHIMRWPAPWSDGFPGWHLECTTMSTKYLGERFDIHGGGLDLKFPHHECEIAQATASSGQTPVNYWMHANLLTIDGKKMSKSTGNTLLPREILTGKTHLLSKGYSPSVTRFLMMQTHYRSVMDFSDSALTAAEKSHDRLMAAVENLAKVEHGTESTIDVNGWTKKCYDSLNDDFNTPVLISNLFEGVQFVRLLKENQASLTKTDLEDFKRLFSTFIYDILGLVAKSNTDTHHIEKLMGTINLLIEIRNSARAARNYIVSDKIRDQLAKLNIHLMDGKDGTTVNF